MSDDDAAKALATLRALLALQGHRLYELAGGGYLVTKWGMTRELRHLQAVLQFAAQVGAAR